MKHPFVRTAWNTYQMHHGPNMTPMVDVVMVILVFFMATASVLGPEWYLKTSIPRTAPAESAASPVETVEVALSLDVIEGRVVVSGAGLEKASLRDLPAALAAEKARAGERTLVVLISPAAAVPYQDLVDVHEACERLGILKVGVRPAE